MLKKENRRSLPDFYDEILIEYQRLKEISPILKKKITNKAKKKHGYADINVPFYLNGFKKIQPFEKKNNKLQFAMTEQDLDISKMQTQV